MPKATPLFVLGSARSGTTWLSNLLTSHPGIVGLTAQEHHGVHESHIFDHTRFALPGHWTCEAFVERYAAEDYFRLANVSRAELCAACPTGGDAITLFGALMDIVARKAGARYWLEKTPKHVIYADTILRRFPEARFVVITRNFPDTMQSQLGLYSNPEASWLRQRLEKVLRYESDLRAIALLKRRAPERVVSVTYEGLMSDARAVTGRVLEFLGLPVQPLVSAFDADSSFGPGRASRPRANEVPATETMTLALGRSLSRFVPLALMRWLRERRDRRDARTFPKYTLVAKS